MFGQDAGETVQLHLSNIFCQKFLLVTMRDAFSFSFHLSVSFQNVKWAQLLITPH